MTGTAIALLTAAIVIVWGGLAASTVFLARRPEVAEWPAPEVADPPEEEI
ncbi:MAG: methionine/alanine import family NSS transporter small subunit [Bifidobacteriaceae bacterium]|jgi:hypothetical protein|nr:methionine/alanine import family NSS transporter small subunit [Bifidobacteriaceae bacterium]